MTAFEKDINRYCKNKDLLRVNFINLEVMNIDFQTFIFEKSLYIESKNIEDYSRCVNEKNCLKRILKKLEDMNALSFSDNRSSRYISNYTKVITSMLYQHSRTIKLLKQKNKMMFITARKNMDNEVNI